MAELADWRLGSEHGDFAADGAVADSDDQSDAGSIEYRHRQSRHSAAAGLRRKSDSGKSRRGDFAGPGNDWGVGWAGKDFSAGGKGEAAVRVDFHERIESHQLCAAR